MVQTVNTAFDQFLTDTVNLDADNARLAKASRDWLVDRLHEFPAKDATFPRLYSEQDIFFGSFERKTKKRPLDDIDIMICLGGYGATYTEYGNRIFINVTADAPNLARLCFDDNSLLNSRKVINKFISLLSNIAQYEKAEINRNSEAATLKLKSYEWNFDIVPCFLTDSNEAGKTFYLIPDGQGHWKKTDPRIDRSRVVRINRNCDYLVLNIIRLIKFWNGRPTMPSVPSYMLENMILDLYEYRKPLSFIDLEFPNVLNHIETAIFRDVQDPKGIQGNLNTLSTIDQVKISMRCASDKAKGNEAWNYEAAGDHKRSISKWAEVFGDTFPTYG